MKLWPWGKWGGGNKKRTHPAAVCDLTRGNLFPAGHTSRRGNGGQAECGNIRQYLVKHLILLQLQFISKVCSIATSWYSISYQMQTLQTLGTSVSHKLRFLAKTQPTSQPGSDLYLARHITEEVTLQLMWLLVTSSSYPTPWDNPWSWSTTFSICKFLQVILCWCNNM